MSKVREGERYEAALAAWEEWHESAGFDPDDDDDYIPEMSVQWWIAFSAGVRWAKLKVEGEI